MVLSHDINIGDLIIRLSMGVKASMRGVNKTPPPIPAITAMMAMVKLSRKNPKVKRAKLFRDTPPGMSLGSL